MSGRGHRRRFGTTHACFRTASIIRPSTSATIGLLSANSRRPPGLPQTAAVDPKASLRTSLADARGGGKRLFILDFHQLTAVRRAAPLPLFRSAVSNPSRNQAIPTGEVRLDDGERVPALRGRASRRFGCERVGCESNFVTARLPETENRTQHTGNLEMSVYPLPCSSAGVRCAFPSPWPHPGGHCSVPRCKATSITSLTNGRKS